MPTYQYECTACGASFERFQSIKAKPLRRCPQCRGRLRRLPGGGGGLLFKGSGFYVTDYRSSGYKERAKQESGGGKEGKPAAERGPGKERKSSGGSKDSSSS